MIKGIPISVNSRFRFWKKNSVLQWVASDLWIAWEDVFQIELVKMEARRMSPAHSLKSIQGSHWCSCIQMLYANHINAWPQRSWADNKDIYTQRNNYRMLSIQNRLEIVCISNYSFEDEIQLKGMNYDWNSFSLRFKTPRKFDKLSSSGDRWQSLNAKRWISVCHTLVRNQNSTSIP